MVNNSEEGQGSQRAVMLLLLLMMIMIPILYMKQNLTNFT
jgi:hypothetical protein